MIFSMWTTTAGRCSSVLNWVISVWLLSAHSNRFFFEPSREIYCQANSQTLHRTSSYTFISDDRRQDDHWKGRTPHFDNFYNKSNIFCFKLNESSCSCSFRFVSWSQKPEFNMIALIFSKLKLSKYYPDSDMKIIAVCRAKLRILVVKVGLILKGILNLAPSELSSHSDLFPIWFGFLRMEHT